MKIQSSIVRLSTKLILPIVFVLLVAYFDYAIIMTQSYLIYILLAILFLALLFVRTASPVYSYAGKLLLLSVLILFSIHFSLLIPKVENFIIVVVFLALLLPVFITQPIITTYIFLALLLFFSYPGVNATKVFNLYDRGTGQLPFNFVLIEVFLYIIALSIVIKEIAGGKRFISGVNLIPCNLYKYFLAFNIIFGFYILWGIATGVPPSHIFSLRGVINITNMSIFIFIMLYIFRTGKDFERVKNFFIIFIALKGIWGLLRFLLLNGDPANMYAWATEGGVPYDIKVITFWDIGDNLTMGVCAFYALWALLFSGNEISRSKKFFFLTVAVICIFDIVFSYRRAAWGGLLILSTWLFLCLPQVKRLVFGVPVLILCATLLIGVAAKRGSQGHGIFHDVRSEKTGEITAKEGRFVELNMAWQSIKKNPIFGKGPWGKYARSDESEIGIPSNLVHSAIVHMGLKMGLIGVLLFISFFYKYVQFWLTRRKELPLETRGFAEASFAGVLFLIPEHLFATSIIEFRTMVLFGFCMAVPYIHYYLYKKRAN